MRSGKHLYDLRAITLAGLCLLPNNKLSPAEGVGQPYPLLGLLPFDGHLDGAIFGNGDRDAEAAPLRHDSPPCPEIFGLPVC